MSGAPPLQGAYIKAAAGTCTAWRKLAHMTTGIVLRPLVAVALLGALVTCASTASAAGFVFFQTPSKNIGCAYQPAISRGDVPTLRCEIRSGLKPLPPHRRLCGEGVFGQAVTMTRRGRAQAICISDTVREPSARVLAYGRSIRVGGFTCTSRQTGLRCTNVAGHGWLLSRQRSSLF